MEGYIHPGDPHRTGRRHAYFAHMSSGYTAVHQANLPMEAWGSRSGLGTAPPDSGFPVTHGGQGGRPPAGAAGGPNLEYAGFWRRFAAWFIDWIIEAIVGFEVVLLAFLVFLPPEPYEDPVVEQAVTTLVGMVVGFLVHWLYYAVFESSPTQATPGKMALGLVVTDVNGRRVSFDRATGRHFTKILSALLLGMAFLMIGFTPRKQGLHDLLAGTLVLARR